LRPAPAHQSPRSPAGTRSTCSGSDPTAVSDQLGPSPSRHAVEWPRPFPIAPPGVAGAGSPIAAVARGGQINVFWIGSDGGVGSTFANPNGSPWHAPFAIAPPGAARPGSPIAAVVR